MEHVYTGEHRCGKRTDVYHKRRGVYRELVYEQGVGRTVTSCRMCGRSIIKRDVYHAEEQAEVEEGQADGGSEGRSAKAA